MAPAFATQWNAFERAGGRPRGWTLVCATAAHAVLLAYVLTAKLPDIYEPELNVVDVVTFQDGSARTSPTIPKTEPSQRSRLIGPKPTDRRIVPPIPPVEEPVLSTPEQVELPIEKLRAPSLPPEQVPLPEVPRLPTPEVTPTDRETPKAAPLPEPTQDSDAEPLPPLTALPPPIQSQSVTIKPSRAAAGPLLEQPAGNPIALGGPKLILKSAPALKAPTIAPIAEAREADVPTPALSPSISPSPAPIQRPVTDVPSPVVPTLALPPPRGALPKVQVPRVQVPKIEIPAEPTIGSNVPVSAPTPVLSGVTSVIGGGPPATAASTNSGSGSGNSGAGVPPVSAGTAGSSGGPAGGGTGILPRRPGGAGVKESFPRGGGNSLVDRMDQTFDCSRLGPDRDARCPTWTPMDGANKRGGKGIPAALPKGVPIERYPIGTNPLPACPPGTQSNQFGLSCLATEEGPGIPKP